jgi:adenylate cyclase
VCVSKTDYKRRLRESPPESSLVHNFCKKLRGRIVTREELRDAIWPDVVKEVKRDSNLNVAITELRKALRCADPEATDLIKTHSGKGYSFTANVTEHEVATTVAILPFETAGNEPLSDETGLKLADALTSRLNKNMSIRVRRSETIISECSEHPRQSPLNFGHRLTADYVFSGHVMPEQESIRVEFLNVRTKEPLASTDFEHCQPESSDSHKRIVTWMESVLGLTPTDQEKEQSTKQPTKNKKANEYYTNGRIQRFKGTEGSLKRAVSYFRRATNEDPNFARAYAGIAETYIYMGMLNLISPQESYYGAKDAALRALQIDRDMAICHAMWAFTNMFFEWQWKEAHDNFIEAIRVNPNYPIAHMGYAQLLTAQARHAEAAIEIKQAIRLDQFDFFISFVAGMVFFLARQYDDSLTQFQRTHELNKHFNLKSDLPHYGCSLAHAYLGVSGDNAEREIIFEQADDEARRAIRFSKNHPLKLLHRALVNALWGKTEDAQKILNRVLDLKEGGCYVSPYHLAIVQASLEEIDLALESLEMAERVRDQYLFVAGVDPRLDHLRSEPRFRELLSRIGLKP